MKSIAFQMGCVERLMVPTKAHLTISTDLQMYDQNEKLQQIN